MQSSNKSYANKLNNYIVFSRVFSLLVACNDNMHQFASFRSSPRHFDFCDSLKTDLSKASSGYILLEGFIPA